MISLTRTLTPSLLIIVSGVLSAVGCSREDDSNLTLLIALLASGGGVPGADVAPASLSILKTYQDECWNIAGAAIPCAGTGQDGEYQKGREADFSGPTQHATYTADYATTDSATGLVWKSCSEGLSGADCASGSASTATWSDAETTCDALNSANGGSGYAGRSDWRLPAITELQTLVHYGTTDAAKTFTEHFPATVTGGPYWSLSTFDVNPSDAWRVNFGNGNVDTFTKMTNYYVRCVSPGSFSVATSFTDNGDGTVTDSESGLIWQKCSRGQTATDCSGSATQADWDAALDYCNSLSLGGKSWRLPNINELKSIVDDTENNPALDTAAFPATESNHYWSSSTYVASTAFAWRVSFFDGNVNTISKTGQYYVRCVSD